MDIILFIIIYTFAIIGYFGVGIFLLISFDDILFDKVSFYFQNFMKTIFYKNNKDNCYLKFDQLFYKNQIYTDSLLWKEYYEPYEVLFEIICFVCWPIWLIVNLLINAFYDD